MMQWLEDLSTIFHGPERLRIQMSITDASKAFVKGLSYKVENIHSIRCKHHLTESIKKSSLSKAAKEYVASVVDDLYGCAGKLVFCKFRDLLLDKIAKEFGDRDEVHCRQSWSPTCGVMYGVCPLPLVVADGVYAKAPLFNNVCEGTFSTLRTFSGKKAAKVGGVAGMINLTRMFLVGYGDVGRLCRVCPTTTFHLQGPLPSMRKKAEDRLTAVEHSGDICREVDVGVEQVRVFTVPSSRRTRKVVTREEAIERVALSLGLPCEIGSVEEFREKILQVNLVVTLTEDSKNFHCGATICSCGTFNKLFTCSHVALVSTVIAREAGRGTSGMDIRLPTVTWGGRPTGKRGPLVRTKTDVVAQGQAKGQEIATLAAAGTFKSPQVKRAGQPVWDLAVRQGEVNNIEVEAAESLDMIEDGQGDINNTVVQATASLGMIDDGQGEVNYIGAQATASLGMIDDGQPEESKTIGKGTMSPGTMGTRRSKRQRKEPSRYRDFIKL
ncbi:hypothetical protein Pmar_PMAR008938 [Perkinsus marinus ATCC 50983]|uniref:SWIM-type domain-containing protein n=1 Tax=Perkinsus marinus (strain ATCC 50983 / TXsc) TaxID=423536 RepID=C5KAE6_PERM5|nr:hypothetical protein Pmar_PMAR008938 [Perkinsus marinus ATCC 50983]EER18607.1 hypothetical protein Pmar_PMAR008938 [Perkinsus marinus ATCC 50983]|eukprot:XP_002786811.1 hypothetical protein Pmar_PMAR008938 [Perkinsus marinus ATCC 50983]